MRQDPIRSFEQWSESLRNYAWLTDDIPGASDVDMLLHASNPDGDSFLVFEFKSAGQLLPRGQRILLDGLRKLPGFTVVVAWGPDAEGEFVLGLDWSGKITKACLAAMVNNWWSQAKRRKAA